MQWRRIFGAVAAGVVAFGVVVGGYAAVSRATLGAPAVLQKAGNLGKQFSEQLDWEQAARETYGTDGKLLSPATDSPSLPRAAPPHKHQSMPPTRCLPQHCHAPLPP